MKSENSKPCSRLEEILKAGHFAVTAELNPPDSADPEDVYKAARVLAEVCDGINAVDASGANCHTSSVAMCALLTRAGYEPIYQVTCRDRNRIALQGDMLGAAAMGVLNVLCLTGDDVSVGDQPEAKSVFDFDSTKVTFRNLTQNEITAYVNSGEPFDKAGGYGAQGMGSLLIKRVDGCFFNVVGFPLAKFFVTLDKFLNEL